MPRDPYLSNRCRELEELLNYAGAVAARDEKLGAHLANYLTVLITGVVEDCIEYLLLERAGRSGDTEVQNYVRENLRYFRNPRVPEIVGLLNRFSQEYGRAFTGRIPPGGKEADALKSVVDNKDNLGHKGTWKLDMTVGDVDDYYRRVVSILEALEAVLLPTAP